MCAYWNMCANQSSTNMVLRDYTILKLKLRLLMTFVIPMIYLGINFKRRSDIKLIASRNIGTYCMCLRIRNDKTCQILAAA